MKETEEIMQEFEERFPKITYGQNASYYFRPASPVKDIKKWLIDVLIERDKDLEDTLFCKHGKAKSIIFKKRITELEKYKEGL